MNFTLEQSTTEEVPHVLDEIVRRILSQSKSTDSLQKDFLFVVLMVSMVENGFSLVDENFELVDVANAIDIQQLAKWKTPGGVIQATFVMSGFESILLKLLMSPLGGTALVNLVIVDLNSDTYTVCLPVSRYVVSPHASTVAMIFRDLKLLSVTFKNKILSMVKSRILSHCGYPSASLLGIPEEVLYKIVLYVPIVDIVSVSKSCRRIKFLMDNEILWHELYKRDFNNETQHDRNDWKALYQEAYVARRDNSLRQRRRGAGALHDHMDYSDFVSYVDNSMWDVII